MAKGRLTNAMKRDILSALVTAKNKGRSMCHVHPCRKQICPDECDCAKRRKVKLGIDTSVVWIAALKMEGLWTDLDYTPLASINRFNRFPERVSRVLQDMEVLRNACSQHRTHGAYRYVSRVIDLMHIILNLYENGDTRNYWNKTNMEILKLRQRVFREVKHLR